MRSLKRVLAVALPLLVLATLGGCKDENWGKDIESPPVDLQKLREEAKARKLQKGQQPPPLPAQKGP